MAYITIRVVGHDGRPKPKAKVQIAKDALLGSWSGAAYTDSEGQAEIRWDSGSPIAIYVNGSKVKGNEQVKARFTVAV